MKLAIYLSILLLPLALNAAEWPPSLTPSKEPTINGRKLETYQHSIKPEWGYEKPQEDTFVVLHPEKERRNAPLYVVLHSAGHDVHSALNCTKTVGNHDIYRSPRDHYALYLDCRKNRGDWWWGGMHARGKKLIEKNAGADLVPVEKRVIDCVKWVIKKYGIDSNRVYLSGNSMGGSGTLGIGMRHGDVFAAIKANVPAGIEHVSHRMQFPPFENKKEIEYPDPPVCIDYSGQNDGWAHGHDRFIQAMSDRKYALYMYWGPFGHANNSAQIKKTNDLIDSLDWLSIKLNEAYPVFTKAKSDDKHPWPDDTKSKASGQINGFFRWKNLEDSKDRFKVLLYLASPKDLTTKFKIPKDTKANLTFRRVQKFKLEPGESFIWSYGSVKGEGKVDSEGLITIPQLTISNQSSPLTIQPKRISSASKAKEADARLQVSGKGWRVDRAKIIDKNRPRVLLIGDSILSGYFKRVIRDLEGKAYVDGWINPHWQSEGTNKLLAGVLTNGPYDVVHFNMGLHGWAKGRIKAGTFEPLTKAYVKVLKTKLPKAKLIWASSTPVTAKESKEKLDSEINPIIVEHNRMAAKVMREENVPINDFYTLLDKNRKLAKGDRFHWTGPAYKMLGKMVTESVLKALGKE